MTIRLLALLALLAFWVGCGMFVVAAFWEAS